MENKIVLQVHKPESLLPGETVRISREAANVLKSLQRETGLSFKTIASRIIVQAASMVEVEEV